MTNHAIAYEADTTQLQLSERTTGARVAKYAASQLAVKLTDLLEKYGINDYALVSDIEGGEYDFLCQDAAALKRCRQIIIELHDTSQVTVGEMLKYITDNLGYRLQAKDNNVYILSL